MNFSNQVKALLQQDIESMATLRHLFVAHPDSDMTRNRKINFQSALSFILSMEKDTMDMELLKFYGLSKKIPTPSAFYQQRQKLKTELFPYLLNLFNSHFPPKLYGDILPIACDGSEFNIFLDPGNPDTYFEPNGKSNRGFNLIHVTALYDILNRQYLDAVIQPGKKKNEYKAICEMADQFQCKKQYKPLFIADRGFGSYNFYAHAIRNGIFFLVRVKDLNALRLLGAEDFQSGDIDISLERILTRSHSKKKCLQPDKGNEYRCLEANVNFDFLPVGSLGEYTLRLRFVRFQIADGAYENLVTNLPENHSLDNLKTFYHLR